MPTDHDSPPSDPRLLDIHGVAGILTCSRRHVLRLVARGAFPSPIRIGALRRWTESQVLQWIGAQSGDARRFPRRGGRRTRRAVLPGTTGTGDQESRH